MVLVAAGVILAGATSPLVVVSNWWPSVSALSTLKPPGTWSVSTQGSPSTTRLVPLRARVGQSDRAALDDHFAKVSFHSTVPVADGTIRTLT